MIEIMTVQGEIKIIIQLNTLYGDIMNNLDGKVWRNHSKCGNHKWDHHIWIHCKLNDNIWGHHKLGLHIWGNRKWDDNEWGHRKSDHHK